MNENSVTRSSQFLPLRLDELLGNLLEIGEENKSNNNCGFSSEDSSEDSSEFKEVKERKKNQSKCQKPPLTSSNYPKNRLKKPIETREIACNSVCVQNVTDIKSLENKDSLKKSEAYTNFHLDNKTPLPVYSKHYSGNQNVGLCHLVSSKNDVTPLTKARIQTPLFKSASKKNIDYHHVSITKPNDTLHNNIQGGTRQNVDKQKKWCKPNENLHNHNRNDQNLDPFKKGCKPLISLPGIHSGMYQNVESLNKEVNSSDNLHSNKIPSVQNFDPLKKECKQNENHHNCFIPCGENQNLEQGSEENIIKISKNAECDTHIKENNICRNTLSNPSSANLVSEDKNKTTKNHYVNENIATAESKPLPQVKSESQVWIQNRATLKTVSVKNKHYMLVKRLGVGGSSEVHKVLEVETLNEFAIKSVNLNTNDNILVEGYINEIHLLKSLQGADRVVKLFDFEYCPDMHSLKVILEVGETDLSSFLKSRAPERLPIALILYYWQEMLKAVEYIHSKGIIHADLKPANFLLVSGCLKLIDFGIASAVSCDATSVVRSCAVGTFSYISPEALTGGAGTATPNSHTPIKISYRSDVWSLGCILYSMIYGKTPFSHITNTYAKIATIVNPKHQIEFPETDVPEGLCRSLRWCLKYDSRARPYVADLLRIDMFAKERSPLPDALLRRIQPHVNPQEMQLLLGATIENTNNVS